ncbi:hypothetical protein [Megamonas hypermegale]|uniref:hypothetical protein n=1 Tax=Megamonas hypermegale TaxID=158847 RepID=UPI001956E029|nr:hypothetical protein [Megamonas hypermegale]MBM6833877.1 hypothetical protein [Megamonas hypermegale]
MGKIFVRSLMFISSYFPLYIFLLILQYKVYKDIDFVFTFENIYMVVFVISMIFFILLSFLSMYLLKKSSGSEKITIKKINRTDDNIISYIFTYILPIISFSLDDFPSALVNFLIFILVGFIYIKMDLMYLNPLWTLQGYISYEMEDKYIITDIPINTLRRNIGESLRGYSLSNGIFVAKAKDNKDDELDEDVL